MTDYPDVQATTPETPVAPIVTDPAPEVPAEAPVAAPEVVSEPLAAPVAPPVPDSLPEAPEGSLADLAEDFMADPAFAPAFAGAPSAVHDPGEATTVHLGLMAEGVTEIQHLLDAVEHHYAWLKELLAAGYTLAGAVLHGQAVLTPPAGLAPEQDPTKTFV